MDTLLKTRILDRSIQYSLSIPEINAIYVILHVPTNVLVKISDILDDILHNHVVELSDIPNIILLLATVFRDAANECEIIDTEFLFILIKITALCILDNDPKTQLFRVRIPEYEDSMVIESMINSCLELLQMKPLIHNSREKTSCCHWFF